MLLTVMSLKAMLSAIALLALLVVVFGTVMRNVERLVLAQLGIGVLGRSGTVGLTSTPDPESFVPSPATWTGRTGANR